MEREKHYSRRERRALAKQFGLKLNNSRGLPSFQRSIAAGRSIDQQFKNRVETDIRNARANKEVAVIKNLTESVGEERALAIVENNNRLRTERMAKLSARRAKQSK